MCVCVRVRAHVSVSVCVCMCLHVCDDYHAYSNTVEYKYKFVLIYFHLFL